MIMGTENAEDHVCAYAWARTTHDDVTCQLVFPDEYDQHQPAKEVHTPEYYGPIKGSRHALALSLVHAAVADH